MGDLHAVDSWHSARQTLIHNLLPILHPPLTLAIQVPIPRYVTVLQYKLCIPFNMSLGILQLGSASAPAVCYPPTTCCQVQILLQSSTALPQPRSTCLDHMPRYLG